MNLWLVNNSTEGSLYKFDFRKKSVNPPNMFSCTFWLLCSKKNKTKKYSKQKWLKTNRMFSSHYIRTNKITFNYMLNAYKTIYFNNIKNEIILKLK